MLLTEWNWDDALEVRRQEGVEEGIARGLEEGRAEGIAKDREEILKLIDAGYTAEALRERLMAERAKRRRSF
jgi:flagellar biosynthesis/type III secretory pathway protein FliH